MSYSWGVGAGQVRSDGLPPLHASVGIVPVKTAAVRPVVSAPPAAPTRVAAEDVVLDPPVNLELRRLAVELAPMIDVWQRLLHEHTPDLTGRCRTCTKGGTGLPTIQWPCSIHGIADLARRCHDAKSA